MWPPSVSTEPVTTVPPVLAKPLTTYMSMSSSPLPFEPKPSVAFWGLRITIPKLPLRNLSVEVPDEVAALETTTVLLLVMLAIVVPMGKVVRKGRLKSSTYIPTDRSLVAERPVICVLPVVVVAARLIDEVSHVAGHPNPDGPDVKVSEGVPVAVALGEITIVVAFVMLEIVVPLEIPAPETPMPVERSDVWVSPDTVVLLFVVDPVRVIVFGGPQVLKFDFLVTVPLTYSEPSPVHVAPLLIWTSPSMKIVPVIVKTFVVWFHVIVDVEPSAIGTVQL